MNSYGILELIKENISNGVVEGLNNKIKVAF
ncbi:transposase [Methanococcoides seepicolus]|uniref:Transposase n=1 Tax=Methanococcoides seepicolus TaxID=2828780 RepID=A0A9E4ZK00_9EURY|nr:transposase [Methanococcoides seepicolus]